MEAAAAGVHRQRHCDSGIRAFPEWAMNPALIVFFILAALCVIGALSLILQKHPIHSALSLIVVMVSLAGLYLLLGAEFVAAVQIIVYGDRKSTRLNSSHTVISYAVFCLKKKN